MKKFLLLLTLSLATVVPGYAGDTKMTVSAPSGQGKVYAEERGNNSIINASQINQQTLTATVATGRSDDFYTLYAAPEPGYAFKEWTNNSASGVTVKGIRYGQDANNQFTNTLNPLDVRVSKPSSGTAEAKFSPVFVPAVMRVFSNDYSLGTASIDKPENAVGDQVTVTAAFNTPHATWQEAAYQNHSRSVTFDGWYNDQGVCVSQDLSFTYTIAEAGDLEARFSREFVFKPDADGRVRGYFRLQSPITKSAPETFFFCITGDFAPSISTSSGTYIYAAVRFNLEREADNPEYCKSEAVYSDAGSIIYITGTMTDNQNATKAYTKVITSVEGQAQGVSTQTIMSAAGKNLSPWLATSCTPGLYRMYLLSGATLQASTQKSCKEVYVSAEHLDLANNRDMSDFDVQPVDLEHVDTNYFGAYPSENMEFDGGYWTSMYTSFPYECYQPDGVEAYVVKSVADSNGQRVAMITLLEDGIVPEATPVLLKCQGLTPGQNRLIPLLPDDERLAAAATAAEGNLLRGDYGLFSDEKFNGRTAVTDNMRVFSVNGAGELGFYKLSKNADGSARTLVPNRAYMDLNNLPADAQGAPSLRIAYDHGSAGVGDVLAEPSQVDAPAEYYTIEGIRVAEPTPGRIYIRRQGNTATKIRF